MTQPRQPTVLVTGATSGIGRHAALHLAERGYRVFASGRREHALASLRDEGSKRGAEIETLRLDVTDPESIEAARALVDAETDGRGLDVLINNAGYGLFGPLELITDEDLRAQFETNVFGLMAVTRAFVPAMRERGRGRVLNVSSIGGRITFPFGGAYHATKYAVEAMSDALRRELGVFGVDVVLIEPGMIRTEFATRTAETVEPYAQIDSPYRALAEQAGTLTEKADDMAADPIVISRAIERAIRARRPRARYVAPFSGKMLIGLIGSWLPTRLVDALMRAVIRRQLGGGAATAQLSSGAAG